MGKGERDRGEIWPVVGFGGTGNRMGRTGEVAMGVEGLEETADAETGEVWGSTGPLRKALKSQDGNLDERAEALISRRSTLVVEVVVTDDRAECIDRIED